MGVGTAVGLRRERTSKSTATAATITTINAIRRYSPVPEVQENPPGEVVDCLICTVRLVLRDPDRPSKSLKL
jgi:hypothetical protein